MYNIYLYIHIYIYIHTYYVYTLYNGSMQVKQECSILGAIYTMARVR